jgi:hypothetical protein
VKPGEKRVKEGERRGLGELSGGGVDNKGEGFSEVL